MLQLGVVVALPLAVGAIGPIGMLAVLTRISSRRAATVAVVTVQAGVLGVLGTLQGLGLLGVEGLVAGVCLYQLAGQAAGTAWASWFGDLVAPSKRGRWFSRRNRIVYVSTCVGLVTAGLFLQWSESGPAGEASGGIGFAVLFLAAAGFRLVSAGLLARTPEPVFAGVPSRAQLVRFVGSDRGRLAIRVLLLGAGFHFVVYWSSPYFAPFMLEDLRFEYYEYMLATIAVVLAKAGCAVGWGRIVDGQSSRLVFLTAMIGVALVPLPWVWSHGLGLVIAAQILSGAVWSGYEIGYLGLLLEGSSRKTRPFVFAAQSLLNGTMQISGTLFAATVLIPHLAGYREVFLASALARLGLVVVAPLLLAGVPLDERVRWSDVGVRLFGLRAHGGFSVRPVLPAADDEGNPDRT